ncbi:hypothetical protein AVEN_140744-1 [Araneus ventricosus]|uniref:Uncharacterized protein n=1 Tax=Araneus ventricosus TaxID=182803 RepID=A0A4Y2F213_ARAVE|nr:hypothetical protein AVEN_140744-1 [Araneus ventricosus]
MKTTPSPLLENEINYQLGVEIKRFLDFVLVTVSREVILICNEIALKRDGMESQNYLCAPLPFDSETTPFSSPPPPPVGIPEIRENTKTPSLIVAVPKEFNR